MLIRISCKSRVVVKIVGSIDFMERKCKLQVKL